MLAGGVVMIESFSEPTWHVHRVPRYRRLFSAIFKLNKTSLSVRLFISLSHRIVTAIIVVTRVIMVMVMLLMMIA